MWCGVVCECVCVCFYKPCIPINMSFRLNINALFYFCILYIFVRLLSFWPVNLHSGGADKPPKEPKTYNEVALYLF